LSLLKSPKVSIMREYYRRIFELRRGGMPLG